MLHPPVTVMLLESSLTWTDELWPADKSVVKEPEKVTCFEGTIRVKTIVKAPS